MIMYVDTLIPLNSLQTETIKLKPRGYSELFNCINMTSDELISLGSKDIKIEDYDNYLFLITAKTNDGNDIRLVCGDNIWLSNFHPLNGWDEWLYVGIKRLTINTYLVCISDL